MSEKILFVSPFYDGTGYANAGIATALGLDAAGAQVRCKTVKMCPQVIKPDPRIVELESNNIGYPTHVIQNWLPITFFYVKGAKNIGYFFCETTHFKPSSWQYYLNLMDEVWVSCKENYEACKASGVTKPIKIVPFPYIQRFVNNREQYRQYGLERFGNLRKNNRYLFYTIGDYSERKNIKELIRTYFRTFNKSDNVALIVKTYAEGKTSDESRKLVLEDIKSIKQEMRKYSVDAYPPINLITDYLSVDDIYALHGSCDCYISLEKGAAWNIPAFDAMLFGNYCILNGWGGQNQYIRKNVNGRLLDYTMVPVNGMATCPYDGLYTCHEKWAEPFGFDAEISMEKAYRERIKNVDNKLELAKFSPEEAGKVLRNAL